MGRRVAIIQSNYIPWKGYFDIINSVDLFVFHDDLQFTKQDWRNRNKIKSGGGSVWLTIPTGSDENRLICEVEIKDDGWKKKHRRRIEAAYSKAPYYSSFVPLLDFLYENGITNLSTYNQESIKYISRLLGIHTEFCDSRSLNLSGAKTGRVLQILKRVGATYYLSGPAAKSYLEEDKFASAAIELEYMNYSGYPEYHQLFPPFDHCVTILDLLFNEGPNAQQFMKSFGKR